MFQGKIKQILRNEPSPEELTVVLGIMDGDNELEERRLAYPLGISEAELVDILKKHVAVYEQDKLVGEQSARVEADNANADQLKEKLENQII